MSPRTLCLAAVVLASLACAGAPPPADTCRTDARRCDGNKLMSCQDGRWLLLVDCAAAGGVCNTGEGADPELDPETSCAAFAAACPYVDVQVGGRWVEAGEILRDLRRPSLEGPQELALPSEAVEDGLLRVRLAERKPEVTQLDAVWLELGGRPLAPTLCPDSPLCAVDGQKLTLRQGEEIELLFEVGDSEDEPVLWAHGHYVPLRAR
jgi:hypothetical protein